MVWVGPNTNQAIMENVHVKRSGSSMHFKFYAAVNARHGRIGELIFVTPTTGYNPGKQYKVGVTTNLNNVLQLTPLFKYIYLLLKALILASA